MAEIIPFSMGEAIPSSCLTTCSYCSRSLTQQRVFAAHKPYCNVLCAAFGLLRTVAKGYGAEDGMTIDTLQEGVDQLLCGGIPIPVRVRDSDIEQALATRLLADRLIVPISDDGTADWPNPSRRPTAC